jgi:hypothetical protein
MLYILAADLFGLWALSFWTPYTKHGFALLVIAIALVVIRLVERHRKPAG